MSGTGPVDSFVAAGGTSGAPTDRTSRYYGLGTASWTRPDGTEVRYLQRRIIPQPEQYTTMQQHVVVEGDRIDNVANHAAGRSAAVLDPVRRQRGDRSGRAGGRAGTRAAHHHAGGDQRGGRHDRHRAAAVASGLYLTLLVGPMVALPAPKPIVDALTSVEVTTTATGRSAFQLAFTLANRSPLQTVFLLAPGRSGRGAARDPDGHRQQHAAGADRRRDPPPGDAAVQPGGLFDA